MSISKGMYQIRGTLFSQETGTPLSGLEVFAMDRDLLKDDMLGVAKVGEDGSFLIEYRAERFNKDLLEGGPDIFFIVKKDNEIVHVSPKVLKGNARALEHFDLKIPDPIFAGGSVPLSRTLFKTLSANIGTNLDVKNPNLQTGQLASIIAKHNAVRYEELKCIGYRPEDNTLEGIFEVKERIGYNGGLCQDGSKEYVAFYIDYEDGAGFVPAGPATSVAVHDLSTLTGSVWYAVRQNFIPKVALRCHSPKVVKLRAILSWERVPTGPDFQPFWGNVEETHIVLKPSSRILFGNFGLSDNFEFPKLADSISPQWMMAGSFEDIANAVELSKQGLAETLKEHKDRGEFQSKITRNPNYFGSISPKTDLDGLTTDFFHIPGLNLGDFKLPDMVPVEVGESSTRYEELTCVGLHPESDVLESVFEVKLTSGFNGGLCTLGSLEYVAYYIDYGAGFEYVATDRIRVHDIPAGEKPLSFASRVRINDIAKHLKTCNVEQIVRVRAILSWNQDPTLFGANFKPRWGNVLTRKVQLRPLVLPGQFKIDTFSLMDVDDIPNVGTNAGYFEAPGLEPSPFGGYVAVGANVNVAGGVFYRLRYREAGGLWKISTDPRYTKGILANRVAVPTINPQGWFSVADYQSGLTSYPELKPAFWQTGLRNGLYEIQIEIADVAFNVIASDSHAIYLDNQGPEFFDIPGGLFADDGVAVRDGLKESKRCGKFIGSEDITVWGNFTDPHFDYYTLYLSGGEIPNVINLTTLNAVGPTGTLGEMPLKTFKMLEVYPNAVNCAYQIQLNVYDRTIVGGFFAYAFTINTGRNRSRRVSFNWEHAD